MQTDQQTLQMLREQIPAIMLGSVFVFVGATAIAIFAVRHRKGMRVLLWFGLFSEIYGARLLVEARAFVALLPNSLAFLRPYAIAVLTYVILIPALLVWLDLSRGGIRKAIKILTAIAVIVAILGIGTAFIAGTPGRFMPINNLLAIVLTLVIAVVNVVPPLARRYFIIQSPVLAVGSLVLAVVALQVNLATFLPLRRWEGVEPLAFAVFVLAVGYVAVERVLLSERRLLSMEQELALAREIQNSILPSRTPEVHGLRIAAAYYPAASVAGDFYEFVQIDERRAGLLIADVSGHGVPAALIASMIKIAMQAVEANADDPSKLLNGLNRILTQQLNGQFVTAAYLYVDTGSRVARYSGAGHPPLLHWRSSTHELAPVQSNGLLFGVSKEAEYPTIEIPFAARDRFLLYTDGLIEPENASGEAFGDKRIHHLLQQHEDAPPSVMTDLLFKETSRWQRAQLPQADDISLIVVDVI
jgi:sigma-B regulation protein RsbU (phosphoserine phosphatase)